MKLGAFCLSLLLLPAITVSATERVNLYGLIVSEPVSNELVPLYEQDAATMQIHLQKIATHIHACLHMEKLAGKDATLRNVNRWVKELPKNKKSIVFLYYVGKGMWEQGSKRPSMCLGHDTLSQKWITKKIRLHHPKLVLSFFDCYDKVINYQHQTKYIKERDDLKNKFHHVKDLFLHAKGYLIGSSASSPESSYGILYKGQPIGGFFSALLFDSLKNGRRSWKWQFSIMHHHIALLKNFKQSLLISNGVDKISPRDPICK
jgi:hypothetical protein